MDKFDDIKNYKTFTKIEPIHKGWSNEKKFYIETIHKEKFLLRISDIAEFERKEKEFSILKRFATIDINMSKPIDFGVCGKGNYVYQLLSWCEGEEAKIVLATLSQSEQYQYGIKAGKVLKKLNSAETYEASNDWAKRYSAKIANYIAAYRKCGFSFVHDDFYINYIENNIHLMNHRPTCLTHEDFQTDNLVISPDGEIFVIDFQQCGIADPYYSLMSAMISADESSNFATGQIKSYFDGAIPDDFWPLFLFYFVAETMNGFTHTTTLGKEEIEFSHRMIANTMESFDNLQNPVPTWFSKNL